MRAEPGSLSGGRSTMAEYGMRSLGSLNMKPVLLIDKGPMKYFAVRFL